MRAYSLTVSGSTIPLEIGDNRWSENWDGEIPEEILNRDSEAKYEATRVPSQYLK